MLNFVLLEIKPFRFESKIQDMEADLISLLMFRLLFISFW